MQDKIKKPDKISVFERTLAAIVLFYGAVVFCLPVPFSEEMSYPWWATTISFGKIVLYEAIFLVWISLYGFRFVLRRLLNGGIPTHLAAIFFIALAIWCGLVSLSSPLPLQDLGRSFRLLLMAALMIAVVRWTRQTEDFPLFMLLLGFFTGTVINLVMSFLNPLIVNETMRLSGQNTPGVAMGIAIHLAAWLYFHSSNRMIQFFTIATTLVFAFGCGISYSRIGWFSGALGMVAWAYILILARPSGRIERARMKRSRRVWVPLLSLALVLAFFSPVVEENLAWIQSLVQQKFDGQDDSSNESRTAYFIGVAEIIVDRPLGVGYSGFYDAMTATEIYRSGRAAEETSLEANPHSGFLYYISAGGIIGGILAVALFVFLLHSMCLGLVSAFGPPGGILFALVAASFLLMGLTVPYIFNSIIMIVPTAIAAGWGWSRRVQHGVSKSTSPAVGAPLF
jgi:O-antigen ligase